tara:strand:+ start:757 stop:1317 length:561 start_codon:yes stop_codon:yes gene_type:complete
MNILIILSLTLFPSNVLNTNRREIIKNSILSQPIINNVHIEKDKIDYYGHWSFYGLIPPPIEKTISLNELKEEIIKENILSLQIAPQHDCIIATTIKNHRYSCLIKDKDFNYFLKEEESKNLLNFQVLPIDKNRQKLRNIGKIVFGAYIIRFLTYEIPKNYNFIKNLDKNLTFSEKVNLIINSTYN